MPTKTLFPTKIYIDQVAGHRSLNKGLLHDIQVLSQNDIAGIKWSNKFYRNGYTSYNSINDLHLRFPDFIQLKKEIDLHVKKYTNSLKWNLLGKKLHMTVSWVSVMAKDTYHTMHMHPLSVISGTYYIHVPKGSSAIKLEDPKIGNYMNSPAKKSSANLEEQNYYHIPAKNGQLILFESWLRHEVPPQSVDDNRVSFSFNYEWY